MTLEERQAAFREMLLDREVSAFSTWDKELHKIVFDPRYLLLSGRERKLAYESFIKSRAEDERLEKRNRLKDNRETFKKLLESANLSSRATFSDFAQKHGKDAKFKAIEKMKEREQLFNEWKMEQSDKKRERQVEVKEKDDEKEVKEEKRNSRDKSSDRSRERKDSKDSKAKQVTDLRFIRACFTFCHPLSISSVKRAFCADLVHLIIARARMNWYFELLARS